MKGFVRTKMIHGKPRNYLVQSYRDYLTGQPRQRVLAYLGTHNTAQGRIAELQKNLRKWRRQLQNAEKWLLHEEAQRDMVPPAFLRTIDGGDYMQREAAKHAIEARKTVSRYLQNIHRAEASLHRLKPVVVPTLRR